MTLRCEIHHITYQISRIRQASRRSGDPTCAITGRRVLHDVRGQQDERDHGSLCQVRVYEWSVMVFPGMMMMVMEDGVERVSFKRGAVSTDRRVGSSREVIDG